MPRLASTARNARRPAPPDSLSTSLYKFVQSSALHAWPVSRFALLRTLCNSLFRHARPPPLQNGGVGVPSALSQSVPCWPTSSSESSFSAMPPIIGRPISRSRFTCTWCLVPTNSHTQACSHKICWADLPRDPPNSFLPNCYLRRTRNSSPICAMVSPSSPSAALGKIRFSSIFIWPS